MSHRLLQLIFIAFISASPAWSEAPRSPCRGPIAEAQPPIPPSRRSNLVASIVLWDGFSRACQTTPAGGIQTPLECETRDLHGCIVGLPDTDQNSIATSVGGVPRLCQKTRRPASETRREARLHRVQRSCGFHRLLTQDTRRPRHARTCWRLLLQPFQLDRLLRTRASGDGRQRTQKTR